MGFLSKMISATVKTVLTPIAIVKDVANVIQDKDVTATEDLISGVVEDLSDATDELTDGNL